MESNLTDPVSNVYENIDDAFAELDRQMAQSSHPNPLAMGNINLLYAIHPDEVNEKSEERCNLPWPLWRAWYQFKNSRENYRNRAGYVLAEAYMDSTKEEKQALYNMDPPVQAELERFIIPLGCKMCGKCVCGVLCLPITLPLYGVLGIVKTAIWLLK